MALPLGQETHPLPASVREIVIKARTSWLKNADVLDILLNFQSYGLPVAKEPPNSPPGKKALLEFQTQHMFWTFARIIWDSLTKSMNDSQWHHTVLSKTSDPSNSTSDLEMLFGIEPLLSAPLCNTQRNLFEVELLLPAPLCTNKVFSADFEIKFSWQCQTDLSKQYSKATVKLSIAQIHPSIMASHSYCRWILVSFW